MQNNVSINNFDWSSGSIYGSHSMDILGNASLSTSGNKQTSIPLHFFNSLTLSSTSLSVLAPLTLYPDATTYLLSSSLVGNSTFLNRGTVIGVEGRSEISTIDFESIDGSVRIFSGATLTSNRTLGGDLGKDIEVNGTAEFVGTAYDLENDSRVFGTGTVSLIDSQIAFLGAISDKLSIDISGTSKVIILNHLH